MTSRALPVPELRRRSVRGRTLGVDNDVLLLTLPGLVPVLVLSVLPLVWGIYLGFTDAQAGYNRPIDFNGLENYAQVIKDPEFWQSFGTGLVWAFAVTVLQFLAGLGLALLLDQRLPGVGALRVLAVLPWAVPPVVVGFMWQLVYNPNGGLLNSTLGSVGLGNGTTDWLSTSWALPAAIAAQVWAGLPLTTVVLVAALQGVRRELREAASLDRAGAWATFRVVTWPAIRPAVITITSLDFIASFNAFGLVYVLTKGSPTGSLELPMLYAYKEAFTYGHFGYSAALGNAMVLVVGVFLALYLRLSLRQRA